MHQNRRKFSYLSAANDFLRIHVVSAVKRCKFTIVNIDNIKNNQKRHHHNKNYNFDFLTFHFQKPNKFEIHVRARYVHKFSINSFKKAKNSKMKQSFLLLFWNAQPYKTDNLDWKIFHCLFVTCIKKKKSVFMLNN